MRLFCVFVVLCLGRGLVTGWSPVQGALSSVKRSRNWEISHMLQSGSKRKKLPTLIVRDLALTLNYPSIRNSLSLQWFIFAPPERLRQTGRTHLWESLRQKSKVLHTTGNFSRFTPAREVHRAFKVSYMFYYYTTKLFRQQTEVLKTNDNVNVYNTGQVEAQHWKYNTFKLGGEPANGKSNDLSAVVTWATIDKA
jgi:hypothetical protein